METNYQDLYEANCKLQSINEQQRIEIDTLKLQLAQIRKMIYGSKQERFVSQTHPEQLSLGIEVSIPVSPFKKSIMNEYNPNRMDLQIILGDISCRIIWKGKSYSSSLKGSPVQ